ncbi:glycerol-3-phosphate acyltransferase [Deinococcus sp. UYEF24]
MSVLLALLLGSLPAGRTVLARAGLNARLNSGHNLGVSNLLYRAGLPTLLAASLPDVLKGLLAVLLASLSGSSAVSVAAGLAVYLGHLYLGHLYLGRLYAARLSSASGPAPRGRGLFILLGVFMGFAFGGTLPVWLGLLPILASLFALAAQRYVSLATLAGLLTFVGMTVAFPLDTGTRLAALALLLVVTWRFKEQFGRLLDSTEPRLGEPVPLVGRRRDEVVAAFMIHPLEFSHLWQAPRLAWLRPLVARGVISERLLRRVLLHVRPMKVGELTGIRTPEGLSVRCLLISVPLLPEVFHENPALATRRATEGARLAQELGAEVFGLGSFWSVVGNKGADVPGITVTNGGAFTSGTVQASVPGILTHFAAQGRDLKRATAAVVGANGVVAFGIARTIAPQVGKLVMVGRDAARLERSATTLRRAVPGTEIVTTTAYTALKEADLIFSATSDPAPVIFPEHVKEGAWIFDEGRPADVDESVKAVPGVRVIPGGVVRPPGDMVSRIDLQFGDGQVPACLAETLIIAATGEHGRQSLGARTLSDNVQFFVREAQRLNFVVVE